MYDFNWSIAFDLDNCLIDFNEGFKRICGFNGYKFIDNDSYELIAEPELPSDKRNHFFYQLYKNFWMTPPFPESKKLLKTVYENMKEPVLIVTSRPIWSAKDTHLLVSSFCTVPYIICFADPKVGKIEYIQNRDVFMEDRRQTVIELLAEGKIVFKPKYPYNKMPKHFEDHPALFEINNPGDIMRYYEGNKVRVKYYVEDATKENVQKPFTETG